MQRTSVWVLALPVVFVFVLCAQTVAAQPFDKAEYAARRARLIEKIPDGVAVFLGASTPSGDYEFRQGHDFFYLTGVEVPDAFLVVDGARKESVLFFTMDETAAEGEGLPPELVRSPAAFTGIERVLAAEQFGSYLAGAARRTRVFYTMFKPEELGRENSNEKFNALQKAMTLSPWDGRPTRELQFVRQLRERFPQVEIRDASPIVWNLRKIKTPAELEVMRRAGRIGVRAHNAFIQSVKPGATEQELAALFEFLCKKDGARDLAYSTIIMSGKHHAWGHYHAYDRTLQAGDFLILDAGPDRENYHVDISTSVPASGKFTPRQRELYEIALAVHDLCEKSYRPGVTFRQVGEKVDGFLKENGLGQYAQQFRGIVRLGGYNHSIGLATHDVMGTFAGPDEVLAPGFVFACDIQLFSLAEEIGIRIEDTIAITGDGYENLSAGVPRTVAEIEALMKKEGPLQILTGKGF
ncbi:MAG: aminopeptidase P N-terminal domain-containing protein [Bacteroidales bacterium]